MSKFNKAIMAILGGVATILAATGVIPEELGAKAIEIIGPIVTAVLVYFAPNAE